MLHDFNPTLMHLDLSKADDFILALVRSRYSGLKAPLTGADWGRMIDVTYSLHPIVFDLKGRRRAANATRALLLELGDLETIDGEQYHRVPKAWLGVFAQAFRLGLINRIVWGAALRTVTTIRGGEEFPDWYTPETLVGYLRAAAPIGMMTPAEFRTWRALPPLVTLYRGGCANALNPTRAVSELVAHIHWTPDHDLAAHYMKGRSWQRRNDPTAGLPVIVQAQVPREAIFAFCNQWDQREVLVEFERIASRDVMDLGAVNYLEQRKA